MIVPATIVRSTGAVLAVGGAPLVFDGRLGDTVIISCAFQDDLGNIIALPEGATGRCILKPLNSFTSGPRWKVDNWTVTGTGTARRYVFRAVLDSDPLRNDLANNPSAAYALQIEYIENSEPFRTADIASTVSNSYFQSSDVVPPVPIGGPDSVEYENEVWGLTERVADGTRWAGNLNRGGDIHNVRLSVLDYAAGVEVQILINGEPLFQSPIEITAQTIEIRADDDPLLLRMVTLESGAKIEVVTTFTGEDYTTAPYGLHLSISMRAIADVEADGWAWLKERIPPTNGLAHHEESQTIYLESLKGYSFEAGPANSGQVVMKLNGTVIGSIQLIEV